MVNKVFYILFLFLFPLAFLYPQWQWQNPLPQGNTLYSVQFVNDNIVWASASGGTLVKSDDGGETWEVIVLPERIYATDVFFINEQVGWTCGTGDSLEYVFTTTDEGISWSLQFTDTFRQTRSVEFANTEDGWLAASRNIFHTADGGNIWEAQDLFGYDIYSINVLDSLHVYAAGTGADGGGILSTSNGGVVWNEDTTIDWAYDVHFLDTLKGWASGWRKIVRTTDGGNNWEVQLEMPEQTWMDIFMIDENYGWAVSSGGLVVSTTNGGDNWLLQDNPTGKGLNGVSFKDSLNGIIVGSLAAFLKSTDGGNNWQDINQAITESVLSGLYFINETTGWIAGFYGTILKTTNSGENWYLKTTGVNNRLREIFFIDNLNGWAVGDNGTILKTTDGGDLWNSMPSPTSLRISDIEFNHYPTGWIVAGETLTAGGLYKTINGGDSWQEVTSISLPAGYLEIQFTSEEVGWIMSENVTVGGLQRLYKTTDGGGNWEVILSNNTDTTYRSIHFINNSVGWISTFYTYESEIPTIFHTTDSGESWNNYKTPVSFNTIYFIDSLKGWGAGITGEIYLTTDGGQSWQGQHCPIGFNITKLQFYGENYGWAIGGIGNIVHTSNGGVSFVNSNQVNIHSNTFRLYQNYPNPFNPVATIKYALQEWNIIKLIVYDVLGKEVITLVDEEKIAGNYEVEFDASKYNLSSGIYFYQLIAGSFSVAKKMVFLK